MKKYALLTSAALSAFLLTACSDDAETTEEAEVVVVEETLVAEDLESAYAELTAETINPVVIYI